MASNSVRKFSLSRLNCLFPFLVAIGVNGLPGLSLLKERDVMISLPSGVKSQASKSPLLFTPSITLVGLEGRFVMMTVPEI